MVLLQTIRRLALVGAVLALGACSTLNTPPAPLIGYQPEAFNSTTHSRHFAAPAERTCEAARRALLSQGYVVTAASGQEVTARKYFQPDVEHHVQLEFRVVCAPEGWASWPAWPLPARSRTSTWCARSRSRPAGVGGIGSLSLPLEGSMDSMVKIASETVSTAEVYERLFNLMGEYLGGMSLAAPPRAVRPS
jgi:hypothetical protein